MAERELSPGQCWALRAGVLLMWLIGLAGGVHVWLSPEHEPWQRVAAPAAILVTGAWVVRHAWLRAPGPGAARMGWAEAAFEWGLVGFAALLALGCWLPLAWR
ncbi:hypothetical protein GobsT_44040 [Gemmata obscuriglobus]|nr:hypothetical protein GobsT_44040 [Gemmata obscuriglobus]VTS08893.1 unnamed protein product [Gemmata obscuriglobus UQM 2246]